MNASGQLTNEQIKDFRLLHETFKNLADCLLIDYKLEPKPKTLRELYNRPHLNLVYSEQYSQAEIIETYREPTKTRLTIHTELLRRLKAGADIETSIKAVRTLFKIPFKSSYPKYMYN